MKEIIQPIVNLLVAGDIQARFRDPNMIEVELVDGTKAIWVTMPNEDETQFGHWGVMALDDEGALSESQRTDCSTSEPAEEVAKVIANWDYHVEHEPDALDEFEPMVAVEMPIEPSAEEAKVLDNPPPLEDYAEVLTHDDDGPGPAEALMGAPNDHHEFYADPMTKKVGADYGSNEGFMRFVSAAYVYQLRTKDRLGQAYFNTLHSVKPQLAEQARSEDIDPFYSDAKIDNFLVWVEKHWDDEGTN